MQKLQSNSKARLDSILFRGKKSSVISKGPEMRTNEDAMKRLPIKWDTKHLSVDNIYRKSRILQIFFLDATMMS